MSALYQMKVKDILGKEISLSSYKGKVLLIVNVASRCTFTSQYEGLEQLYRKYSDKGFVVLGFPCNQFGSQEPGSETQIREFCSFNFSVTFPLFSKIDVNGEKAHPLFGILKKGAPGLFGTKAIKWNFTKFLVDKEGNVYKRFAPKDSPDSLGQDIEKLLNK